MELNHLRYFQAIAQSGSLTAAAKALHVTQPTLTVAMQALEERLGTTLLLRDRSGVRLTATGEELLRYAGDVFALVERAEQQIRSLEKDDVGNFVIGCHESLGAYFLPGFMASFLRAAPRIELSLWNGTSANVQRAVLDRTVHFGLVVNPHPHPDLVLLELFHDAVDLFVAEGAPPSSAPPTSQRFGVVDTATDPVLTAARARLRHGPLVFAGRVSQCRALLDMLAADGLLPTRMLSCGDLELVKSLALAGIGVALLPRRVAAYGHEGKLVRLHPTFPFFPDTICLVFRADLHKTRATLRVKDALVAYGKGL
jgi:DNA-binding transcriptional LysR family regulator